MKTRITLLLVATLALASCSAGFRGSIDNPTAANTPGKTPSGLLIQTPVTGVSAFDVTALPI